MRIMLKVFLYFFALVCVLLALGAFFLPLPPTPKPDAATQQAIDDADRPLGWPFWAYAEPTNDVTISRTTLKVLTRHVESPEDTWRCAWFFSKTTSVFALV